MLTEQSHWVEKDKLTISEFTFFEPPAPILTDSDEILKMLDSLSIPNEDYMTFSDNERIKNSAGKEYVSFNNGNLLEEKGCRKSQVKISNRQTLDKFDDSLAGKYNQIFDWLRRAKKVSFEKLEELVGRTFHDDVVNYQLKIVRGTQRGYQSEYFIFVKSPR